MAVPAPWAGAAPLVGCVARVRCSGCSAKLGFTQTQSAGVPSEQGPAARLHLCRIVLQQDASTSSPTNFPSAEPMAGNAALQMHVTTGHNAVLQALTPFLNCMRTCKSIDLWLTSAEVPAAPVEDDSFREPVPQSKAARRPSKGPALFLVAFRKRAVKSSGPSATASGKAIAGSICAGGKAAAAWLRRMSAGQQQIVSLYKLPVTYREQPYTAAPWHSNRHLQSWTSAAEVCTAQPAAARQ